MKWHCCGCYAIVKFVFYLSFSLEKMKIAELCGQFRSTLHYILETSVSHNKNAVNFRESNRFFLSLHVELLQVKLLIYTLPNIYDAYFMRNSVLLQLNSYVQFFIYISDYICKFALIFKNDPTHLRCVYIL